MIEIHGMQCCAFEELVGISNTKPAQVLQDIVYNVLDETFFGNWLEGDPDFEEMLADIGLLDRVKKTLSFPSDEVMLKGIKKTLKGDLKPAGGYVFTQATRHRDINRVGYGFKLDREIQKLDIGPVMWAATVKNPNSGNWVVMFVWVIDRERFENYVSNLLFEVLKKAIKEQGKGLLDYLKKYKESRR